MTRAVPELATGTELEPRTIGPITQTDVVRFAGAGGDFNPLHHDPTYAEAAGMGGVIAMGQMQAGMLAAWLTDTVGVENLQAYSVRFASPVRLGDTLVLSGTVIDVVDDVAELSLLAARNGEAVVTGRARVGVTLLA